MPWLLLLVFGFLSRHCQPFYMAAHSLFRKDHCVHFVRLCPLLQEFAAQQGKVLNSDSISWNQSQIHFDRAINPRGLKPALKGVDPNTGRVG
jgi:hypothetical protein